MQVLLAQVQNSEQLLQTLQGTVSQAQERVQLQMVRAWALGQEGGECDGNWLRGAHGRLRHLSCAGCTWSWCQEGERVSRVPGTVARAGACVQREPTARLLRDLELIPQAGSLSLAAVKWRQWAQLTVMRSKSRDREARYFPDQTRAAGD